MLKFRFHAVSFIIIALIGGAFVGYFFGPWAQNLDELSRLIITCLKTVAIPLLFVAIVDALLKSYVSARGFKAFLQAVMFNGLCAVSIALFIHNVFHPGRVLSFLAHGSHTDKVATAVSWQSMLATFIPSSILEPFVSGSTPAVIMIALAFGFALRHIKHDPLYGESILAVQNFLQLLFKTLITIIHALVYLIPLAVFCSVAKAVGLHGIGVFNDLLGVVFFFLIALSLQSLLVYHMAILRHPVISIKQFWHHAKAPVFYAFGANSSLATMPTTLDALERLQIKPEAARLSACIGTNFNNDGILLYELLAALMLADAYGLNLSFIEQLSVAGFAVIAACGVAGFPEAGIIALTLVLTMLKLPSEAIGILLSVDWLIARCRSSVNVLGDLAVALHIDRRLFKLNEKLALNEAALKKDGLA